MVADEGCERAVEFNSHSVSPDQLLELRHQGDSLFVGQHHLAVDLPAPSRRFEPEKFNVHGANFLGVGDDFVQRLIVFAGDNAVDAKPDALITKRLKSRVSVFEMPGGTSARVQIIHGVQADVDLSEDIALPADLRREVVSVGRDVRHDTQAAKQVGQLEKPRNTEALPSPEGHVKHSHIGEHAGDLSRPIEAATIRGEQRRIVLRIHVATAALRAAEISDGVVGLDGARENGVNGPGPQLGRSVPYFPYELPVYKSKIGRDLRGDYPPELFVAKLEGIIRADYPDTGALLSRHGAASSSCAASLKSVASSANLPVKWTPHGRPSGVQ